jgi:thiol-disulfide isomerase/thioredoxin
MPTKKHYTRRRRITRHVKAPTKKIIIGKIYAEWCGYCQRMGGGFEEVANTVIKKYGGGGDGGGKKHHHQHHISLLKIPENGKDTVIRNINDNHFKGQNALNFDGYPTIFLMVVDKKNPTENNKMFTYKGNTNFTDPIEGAKNKLEFQTWIETNITAAAPKNQKGGWSWSKKTEQINENLSEFLSKKKQLKQTKRTKSHKQKNTKKHY